MGSQLTKNYNIDQSPCAVGGPANVWRIHKATRKDPQKSPCSIFFFDKKQIGESKAVVSELAEGLKKDATMLAKMKHPNIL